MTGGHPAFNQTDMQCGTRAATSQPRFICVFIFSWQPLKFHKLIYGHFQDNSRTSMTGGPPAFNYSAAQCGTFVATSQPRFICVFIFSWWPLIFHKQIPGHFQDNSRTSMAGGHPAFNQTDMQCGTCAATSQPRFICVLSFNQTATFYLCFYLVIRWLRTVGHMWRQVNHVLFAFFSFHGGH